MNEMIVHDANKLLYEHKVTDKNMQKYFLERYFDDTKREELEKIMKHFGVGYDCDFNKLQLMVSEENKKKNFQIM